MPEQNIISLVAANVQISLKQVETVIELFSEGATIPFIARYRKDKTGGLDEVQIEKIQEEHKRLQQFFQLKASIEESITKQGKMAPVLQEQLNKATTVATLEDIYLPFKPKRKTKSQTARENGLEPLATQILEQKNIDIEAVAASFLNETITDAQTALQGARDIIAETINEDAEIRARLRYLFEQKAIFQSKVLTDKATDGIKFKDYFDFQEPVTKIPSHRILAILRGFLEGFLRISIAPNEEDAIAIIEGKYITGFGSPSVEQIKKAIKDAYKRLLQPSLESELRTALKLKADEEAIQVFAENLKQLLLSAPLGSKRILAIDPGYRTGCKVVCLDETGTLLHHDLIYIHEPSKKQQSTTVILKLIQQYHMQVFAIGDGTAGRETEQFIKQIQTGLPVFLVNEDGASIYSASEIAREEFGDYDVTVRGAVSIGRRLMDPLAELVKIEPKNIGVGQYQHDVNQFRLKEKLDQTIVNCVNAVGVNINTASKHLLSYVSGIGPTLAAQIIEYRNNIGNFSDRKQILNVPRLGQKTFEQCAGFLRIPQSNNPLDTSAVHPEAYPIVEQIAKDLETDVQHIIGNESLLKTIQPSKYISETIGTLTIQDIISELKKPGLDPRNEIGQFEFAGIYSIEDVNPGDILPGIVTNITRFGAFVNIGVKQDGLVHISEIAHRYISDPSEALKLNDKVKVKILEVDAVRKRIALSIKQADEKDASQKSHKPHPEKQQNKDLSHLSVTDALSFLKKKFGK